LKHVRLNQHPSGTFNNYTLRMGMLLSALNTTGHEYNNVKMNRIIKTKRAMFTVKYHCSLKHKE